MSNMQNILGYVWIKDLTLVAQKQLLRPLLLRVCAEGYVAKVDILTLK